MSKRLAGRLVVLGITGSIAAYKSPEIVRALHHRLPIERKAEA